MTHNQREAPNSVAQQRIQLTQRSRRLLESSSDGICEVDAAGCCTYITERGAQLLGYTVAALIGKSLHESIHPPLADGRTTAPGECLLCRTLQSREPKRGIKAVFWHASGHTLPVSCSIAPIISSSEVNGGTVIAFSDDTERLQAEQDILRLTAEVRDAERRETAFITVLSHELRNPLAPIRSALQVMRKGGAVDASTTRLRDMMERQLDHLVRLVNDLMDIARLKSGKISLKKERVTLQEILSSAIEASAAVADANNPLTADVPREPLFLQADATRLTQVFTNLLNNASQYSNAGDPISLRVVIDAGHVRVHITDRGIGIGPEALEQIFEMFTTSGRDVDGTRAGLCVGLNLARRLVELHNGDLIATSEGLGQGSDFVVTLPLAEPTALDSPGSAPLCRSAVQQSVRALIVDDNVDAAESLSLLLKLEGHTTAIASTGPEAISRVSEFKPDVVLLDIGLPGMNGYDVARAIRALPGTERTAFLVAITGWGSQEDRRRSASAGFDEHLTKPVDISMIELLLTTLRSRRAAGNPASAQRTAAESTKAQEGRS